MMKNILTSFLPSNSKRKYVQVAATVNSEAMEKLRSMMERGALRVPIDSCWDMKDALKVRMTFLFLFSSTSSFTVLTFGCRRMKGCRAGERRERSSLKCGRAEARQHFSAYEDIGIVLGWHLID